ncbi:hypothetical protein IJS18_01455 [Candidatus Saccharibacteria bacterium]|nr:hypothetical protein [Candidatus Saccharibacteria bacterium]
MRAKKIISLILTTIIALSPAKVFALSEERLDFFAQNNILFYDPDGALGVCTPSSTSAASPDTGVANVNYAGAQVWSEGELQAISENQAVYEEGVAEYGFPWQVMAVLHSMETGLRRYNPGNGQGVYQLYSYTGGGQNGNRFEPADSISEEEFLRQTKIAAGVAASMAGDLNDPNNVKRLFFMYNGTAQVYKDKAIAMGFSQEEANNGEGSYYVMNRYDEQRDPTSSGMSPHWPGRYVADGVYDSSSTSTTFGAYVKYEAIAGMQSQCNPTGGGNIAEVAILLSWDDFSHGQQPKPEYYTAMQETGNYRVPGDGITPGASCDQFVSTVLRYSGADPDYPTFWPPSQMEHILSHPDMYQEIEHNNDESNLMPGDIFITANANGNNHTFLYIGNGQQASASYGDRSGVHFSGFGFSDGAGGITRYYRVFRRINYNG